MGEPTNGHGFSDGAIVVRRCLTIVTKQGTLVRSSSACRSRHIFGANWHLDTAESSNQLMGACVSRPKHGDEDICKFDQSTDANDIVSLYQFRILRTIGKGAFGKAGFQKNY